MNMKVKDYNIYKKENICVFLILLFSLFISVGYSAISTNLKISGDVAFMKTADIRVIGSSLNGVTNSGAQTTPVSFDYARISGGISLPNLNSTVTITVKTRNYVALDKEITSITNTTFSNSNIEYTISGYSLGDKILGNATTTFTITFKYKSSVTTVPSTKTLNYKLTFNFNNYTPNMMIENTHPWVPSSSGYNWLSGPINSLNIEAISFTTTNTVPASALGSWDVSTKQNGGIMAWYFDNDGDSKYEIVIGSSEGAVLASNLTFYTCYLKNLENFDGANLNISKLNSLETMFLYAGYNVSDFIISNITSWDVSNVTNMSRIFSSAGYNATSWTIGDLSGWDTSNVTNMSGMFNYAGYKATSWSIGDLSGWNTSNVTNMYDMFNNAGGSASTWTIGDLSEWNTSNVTNMNGMFVNAGYSAPTWTIGDLSEWNVSNVTNMSLMFSGAGYSVTTFSLNLSNWDVSNVTNMSSMFSYFGYSVTTFSLNLSNWDVSNVTDMSDMFLRAGYKATTWSIGNLSNWDVSNVTDMDSMFQDAGRSVTTFSLNLSNWDVSKVTTMRRLFSGAGDDATTFSLNLSNWNVSNVTDMSYMFSSTGGLSATTWSIGDLSGWNTSNVTNMSNMFSDAGYNATTWNSIGTLKVYATDISNIFNSCRKAKATINIYSNPTSYTDAFFYSSAESGSGITVNYSSATTNIDAIIATKSSYSNVVKGSLIS